MTDIPTSVLFEYAFEASPEGNILVDEDGLIVMANRNAEKMFAYEQGELVGVAVDMLVPDNLRSEHLQHRKAYLRDPKPRPMAEYQSTHMQLMGKRKDGSSIPLEISLSPIHTGNSLFVFGVMRDISARMQQEQEKRQQAELVRLLQDIAVASNESDSVHQAFQFAVNRICQYLGWPIGHAFLTDEGLTFTPTQIWRSGLSDRYKVFTEATQAIHYMPNTGLPGLVFQSGQPAWINNLEKHPHFLRQKAAEACNLHTGMALPVMVGKDVAGVLEFFHEEDIPPNTRLLAVLPHVGIQIGRVVERKRAEEALRRQAAQLRMVMTNLPVILWVVDSEGQMVMLEGKGVPGAGINAQDFVGKNVLTQLSNRPEILHLIQRALQGEETHQEIVTTSGKVYETFFTPNFDADLKPVGMIGLSFDVSDRKRMESELEEMKQRLMESSDAERARLAQQLHDGPLQDLYGAFYQIQEVRLNLQGQEFETASRALQTIQAVNATLRVICGELHPTTLVHLGLQRAIRGHSERLQDRQEETAVVLDLDDDTRPEVILTQEQRLGLYRVFQQLISNAAYHSGARIIWVRLKLEKEQVTLEVQDNGRGFDAPEHWVQLLRERKFGLVTALERVRSMEGKLEIFSRPNEGALVRVTVPRLAG